MALEAAREQMVEQQVRAADVLDERILEVMRSLPRERFLPERWRDMAFADAEIPLPCGKRMLRPMLVGRILQALEVGEGEQVLEIGTGSGFLSACLALLGGRVRSIELHPEIAELARGNLATLPELASVEVIDGDGMGLTAESSYDVLVLTASLPLYQTRFERALRPGGRLFAVVGSGNPQQAQLVRRSGVRDWNSETLFETVIEALEHAPRPPAFGF